MSLPTTGTTQYIYAGNTVKVTDPAGKWKKYTSNAMGNLTQVDEPKPVVDNVHQGDYITTYSYNALDKLTQVSMTRQPTTQTRTFVYSSNQQLQSATNPETGAVTHTYKGDGSVATRIEAKNQKVAYQYDTLGRLIYLNRHPVSTGPADPCQSLEVIYDNHVITDVGHGTTVWGRTRASVRAGR